MTTKLASWWLSVFSAVTVKVQVPEMFWFNDHPSATSDDEVAIIMSFIFQCTTWDIQQSYSLSQCPGDLPMIFLFWILWSVGVASQVAQLQYIPRNMHTVFALLCFVMVIHWLIFPYPSGLLHWHCGNLTIAPVPAKQPWWIWINTSCEFIMNDCITTTKQSTTKPCAYDISWDILYILWGLQYWSKSHMSSWTRTYLAIVIILIWLW